MLVEPSPLASDVAKDRRCARKVPREAGCARLPSATGGLDRDLPGQDLGLLRDRHFEHAVGVACLDGLRVGRVRQAEAAVELAARAFHAAEALLLVARSQLASAPDRQFALLERDVDVLRVDARQVDVDHELLRFLADVDGGHPVDDRVLGFLGGDGAGGHQAIEVAVQAVHQVPRFIAGDAHRGSPFSGLDMPRRLGGRAPFQDGACRNNPRPGAGSGAGRCITCELPVDRMCDCSAHKIWYFAD